MAPREDSGGDDMTKDTRWRREELHRDRWSAFGSGDGIIEISEKLSAKQLLEFDLFSEYPPEFLGYIRVSQMA